MSRHTLLLPAAQRSFLDELACRRLAVDKAEDSPADRPSKRRKIMSEAEGWAAVVEFTIQCQFVEDNSAPSTSTAVGNDTSIEGVNFEFDNPVISITHPDTEPPLFAFVCREEETEVMDKIIWYQTVAHKDPSISSCLRYSTSATIRQRLGVLEQAIVYITIETRFDSNVARLSKLSLKERLSIIDFAFEQPRGQVDADQFYSNVGTLPKIDRTREQEETLQHPSLSCQLFPFQKRAVAWMLERERAQNFPKSAGSHELNPDELPPLWETTTDLNNQTLYLNRHQGFSTLNKDWVLESFKRPPTLGGILAEEMGLGKTVEIIDLILLNPRPKEPMLAVPDGHPHRASKATIIITPPTILSQWAGEFAEKAPSLKVFTYPGIQNLPEDFDYDSFLEFDVILATYTVLSREVHYAKPLPDRSMRYKKIRPPRRSPLMEFSWWRVCLDEAQMIEGSVTSAATVACMLPRTNAWCVSGTPCKRDVSDLYGLLVFLRYHPITGNMSLWARLCHDWHNFYEVFRPLVCRNTKHSVKDEMRLPPQTKTLLSVDFTAVEEINYQHIFEQMLDDCGLTPSGTPNRQNWDLNDQVAIKMKRWLVRLRQACSHPGVGTWRAGNKEMRTMDEVLEKMYEDTCTAIIRDEREFFISKIKRGQIFDFNKAHDKALELWSKVLEEVEKRALAKREELLSLRNVANADVESEYSTETEEDDLEDERRVKRRQYLRTKRANELRDLQELQHRAVFMMASANFQLKNEAEETRLYDDAEKLRREILRHPIRRANHFIKRLNDTAEQQQFVEIPELRHSQFTGGIITRKIFERLQPLVDQMNEQANQMDEWREKIIEKLRLSLLDQTVDPDGEEYQAGLDVQEEASAYQEVLRQAVAGRIQATSGFLNELVRDDILRQKNLGIELTPLQAELWKRREEIQPSLPRSDPPLDYEFESLKGAVDLLRNLVGNIGEDLTLEAEDGKEPSNWRRNEMALAQTELRRLQQSLADQNKANAALEKEVEQFRVIYNARIEYYRQLQLLSDTLENYNGDNPERDLEKLLHSEAQLEPKISRNLARRRYLQELKSWQNKVDQERLCVICQSTFEIGALTKCGHLFCFVCLQIWLKHNHTCPVCKERLTNRDWHKIATQKADIVLRGTESSHHDHSFSEAIYQTIDGKVLQQIQQVELQTSFGSKIDNLTRHLLWIQSQGGAKAVVFSQWSDVLDVMERSFRLNGIGYVRFDQKQRKDNDAVKLFKTSDTIQVFMLHSQSQSSGLSLVDATHCFLVEPLINSAIELQAVSRIHRLGQIKPTFVWLYTVNGTVEERVLELSSQKRLGNGKDQLRNGTSTKAKPLLGPQLDESEARGLQQNVGKLLERRGIGEVVETGELWECLFGDSEQNKMREKALKEVQRDQFATAAETRRAVTVRG